MNEYQPDYAIAPGETLEEVLQDREISIEKLSLEINLSSDEILGILNGTIAIKEETAAAFEKYFEIPASFWLNLEKNYQETKKRLSKKKE